MSLMSDSEKSEPEIRVTDRRWWARAEAGETTGDRPAASSLKPTYVEELERRVEDVTSQLQTVMNERRRQMEEFEQVKVRLRRDVAREVERGRRATLAEFLDVLDNIDRAVAAVEKQAASQPAPDGDAVQRL